jgi:hypothetical protein
MSIKPIGTDAYDLGKYLMRGTHELANGVVFQDSNIPLRDHSGLYGSREDRGVEPSQPDQEVQPPEVEVDEPDLEM